MLFDGTDADALRAMAHGAMRGTRVHAGLSRLAARKHWLRHAPSVPGAVLVDAGAARALAQKGASLLPGGVVGVEGARSTLDFTVLRSFPDAFARERALREYLERGEFTGVQMAAAVFM